MSARPPIVDLRRRWLTEVEALLSSRCERLRRAAAVELAERLKGQDLDRAEDEQR